MQQNIQLENKWIHNISLICLTFLLWEKRSFVGFVGGWGIYANNFFQRWCILNTNDANTRATNEILHNKCQTAQTKYNAQNTKNLLSVSFLSIASLWVCHPYQLGHIRDCRIIYILLDNRQCSTKKVDCSITADKVSLIIGRCIHQSGH